MNKLEQAAQLALEAIGDCSPNKALVNAACALREALAEQALQKLSDFHQMMEQEPVAWRCRYCKTDMPTEHASDCPIERFGLPNEYAAPVRTKDLTNDEIDEIESEILMGGGEYIDVIRAVIAADRGKNK